MIVYWLPLVIMMHCGVHAAQHDWNKAFAKELNALWQWSGNNERLKRKIVRQFEAQSVPNQQEIVQLLQQSNKTYYRSDKDRSLLPSKPLLLNRVSFLQDLLQKRADLFAQWLQMEDAAQAESELDVDEAHAADMQQVAFDYGLLKIRASFDQKQVTTQEYVFFLLYFLVQAMDEMHEEEDRVSIRKLTGALKGVFAEHPWSNIMKHDGYNHEQYRIVDGIKKVLATVDTEKETQESDEQRNKALQSMREALKAMTIILATTPGDNQHAFQNWRAFSDLFAIHPLSKYHIVQCLAHLDDGIDHAQNASLKQLFALYKGNIEYEAIIRKVIIKNQDTAQPR